MTILSNIAIVLVLACIAQLVLVADCKGSGRKGKKAERGTGSGNKGGVPKPPPKQPANRHEKGQKTPSVKGVFKGRFLSRDKTQCTWVATGEDAFTLDVNCKKGGDTFGCEYKARPSACPDYASGVRTYWKQIARALKKQKVLCKDPAALVKAGMCKRAPKDAHFKLNDRPRKPAESSTDSTTSSGKSCAESQQQRAKEYCSTSWSSVCNLLFSMIEGGEDC
ncbi:hypothetical protein COCON_G00121190 [Conger conger]|uniref:Fibroblast growth factor-binding protein 1-like n=1 Tax=Conger conger TaxID=82655 RepID=A0A9Q1DH28_CONCO|nr:fibroblast growth factor-binding protein 1 [Conger conger]XP_061109062.1 fibroblast growth factor-binding protein 1 [Conger conger]KAJ8269512.1 hypothetical protein COCON_G00121190 [Conger conger]